MEDEVCQFEKFGFCKFKGECKRRHLTKICKSLSGCIYKKHCDIRHPKNCKICAKENGCRHDKECAYTHNATKHVDKRNKLKEKVVILEKMVSEMTKKL